MCNEEARTGKCTYEERTGRPCKFVHLKQRPAQLNGFEGMTTADLKNLNYDPTTRQYGCSEITAAELAAVDADVQSVAAQLEAEWASRPEMQVEEPMPNGGPPGFQRHP